MVGDLDPPLCSLGRARGSLPRGMEWELDYDISDGSTDYDGMDDTSLSTLQSLPSLDEIGGREEPGGLGAATRRSTHSGGDVDSPPTSLILFPNLIFDLASDAEEGSGVLVESMTTMSTGGRMLLQGVRNITTHFGGNTTLGDFRTPMEEEEVGFGYQTTPPRASLFATDIRPPKEEVTWENTDQLNKLNIPKMGESGEGNLYSVFRYEGVEAGLCLGPVSTNQFCIKLDQECTVKKHSAPSGKPEVKFYHLEPGYYIVNPRSQHQLAAFREPALSLEAADASDIFQIHKDERLPKEAWLSVFVAVEQHWNAKGAEEALEEENLNDILEGLLRGARPGAPTPMFSRKLLEDSDLEQSFDDDDLRSFARSTQKKWLVVKDALQRSLDAINTLRAVMGVPPKLRDDQHTTLWGSVDAVAQALDKHQEELQKVTDLAESGGDRLLALEQQLREFSSKATSLGNNFRSVEARVHAAMADAVTAKSTALNAMNSVNQYKTTGGFGSIANLGTQLTVLEGKFASLDQDFATLAEMMQEVATLGSGGHHAPTNVGVDLGLFESTTAALKSQVAELRQLTIGGGITMGGQRFDSMEDAIVFCKQHLPPNCYECFYDIVSLLQVVDDPCKYAEDVQQQEVHYARVKRLPEQSIIVSSFQTEIPPVLAGPKESHEQAHLFNAMKTYDLWDRGDGVTGALNRINQTLQMKEASLTSMIDQKLEGHSTGRLVCQELLSRTMIFWRELCAEIAKFYRQLLVTTFGATGPYSEAANAQCWTVVLKLVRVLCSELRKVRLVAEHAWSQGDKATPLYLWGCLNAHRVMNDFKQMNFREHPKFYPKLVLYLFETYVAKHEIAKLRETSVDAIRTNTSLETQVASLKRNYDTLAQKYDSLATRLAKVEGKKPVTPTLKDKKLKVKPDAKPNVEEIP